MIYPSPVGRLMLACREEGLAGLWIEGQKYFGESVLALPPEPHERPVLAAARDWLDRYFAGEKPLPSELPLCPAGSAFRQAVWGILCGIPYGSVITYGDIAKEMAKRLGRAHMSAQAVGGAVGHNPISIIIPCHRVVGTNGSLTGYAGGIAVKTRLLAAEGIDVSRLSVPRRKNAIENG